MLKDHLGNTIVAGDFVVYPRRQGSTLEVVTALVLKVAEEDEEEFKPAHIKTIAASRAKWKGSCLGERIGTVYRLENVTTLQGGYIPQILIHERNRLIKSGFFD